jgi:Domain of unknown function (DUF4867)
MESIDRLRSLNPHLTMHRVSDPEFAEFGRIVTGYDFSAWLDYMDRRTAVPAEGNVYVASDPGLEALPPFEAIRETVYGGLDIQAGYCNGLASRLNGLEYHKSPEFFVTQTELVLLLAPYRAMRDFTLDVSQVRAFHFPAGIAAELHGTTLHFAPCRLADAGFKSVIVLLRGTNTDPPPPELRCAGDPEARLLFRKHKWLLAHPDNAALLARGARAAMAGPNLEVRYR